MFDTPWGRLGVCICYDIEHPPLARAQMEAGAWLILVPTDTDTLAGFNRVRLAARACADGQPVLRRRLPPRSATPPGSRRWTRTVATPPCSAPIDRGFPDDGVIARGVMDEPGWLYAELNPATLAIVRSEGAVLNHRDYAPPPPPCAVVACR